MKNLKLMFVLPSLLLISCGPVMKFDGPPNATKADLLKVRFQCAKESMVETASGYIDAFSGSYGKSQRPNCSMMDACISAAGYTRSETGRIELAESNRITCSY